MSKSIQEKFQIDKQSTLNAATDFLQTTPTANPIKPEDLRRYRTSAGDLVKSGNYTEALQILETLRDAKTGVVLYELENGVVARDARNATTPPVRSTEAFEMQYLNAIRAGMDIIDTSNKTPEEKTALKNSLQEKATAFMDSFSTNNATKSQEELAGLLKSEIKEIGKTMEKGGIANAYTKLNIAKDFQNFKDTHSNIVTISTIKDDKGTLHTVVEAEVAMKGLTENQKKQYSSIVNNTEPKPNWYKAMPTWEQELCKKHAPAILAGTHVIPTQLRQVAGMKNAFEKITAIFNSGELGKSGELEVLHTSKHAGTLASLSRDKKARQGITDENARQAQEWVGPNKTLHCNTFNSGPVGAGDDPEIVKRTQTAMKNVGGKETNTSFNSARYTTFASDLSGAKDTLNKLVTALPKIDKKNYIKDDAKALKAIEAHIKPRGWFSRTFGLGKPAMPLNDAIQILGDKIDPKVANVLRGAANLKVSVEQASAIFRFGDAENVSLQTSTKLNQLTQKIDAINPTDKVKGLDFEKVPKEEILNMCASGKDRTGLAEHDQSAQAIATKLGMKVKAIDGQLLKSGHTAQQAGGIYAGGATVGCMGTKSENKAGIPESRKEALTAIVEVTASSNKIKGKSTLKETKKEQGAPKLESIKDKDKVVTKPKSHSVPPFVKQEVVQIAEVMNNPPKTRPRAQSARPPVKKDSMSIK